MNLKYLLGEAGGPYKIAKWLGISPRAIYKWIDQDRLPNTEYSGVTKYSKIIERETKKGVSAKALLSAGRPKTLT